MPRGPIDYSKSAIYKIVCRDLTIKDLYVGSTTELRRRRNAHKTICNNPRVKEYYYPVYVCIRDNGGWKNWDLILVENYPCNGVEELRARERHHMELLGATLNVKTPSQTKQEWTDLNKEHVSAYKHAWHEAHKIEMNRKSRERYYANRSKLREKVMCVCGVEVCASYLKRHESSKQHIQCLQSTAPPQPSQLESTHSIELAPDSPPSNLL